MAAQQQVSKWLVCLNPIFRPNSKLKIRLMKCVINRQMSSIGTLAILANVHEVITLVFQTLGNRK
jgi:hypothetical protein